MSRRRRRVFELTICMFLVVVVYFTTILNSSDFKKNYNEASAENNYIILDSIVERIEYGLHYGKELDNYYDIDSIFQDVEQYCGTDVYYITDGEGNLLYGKGEPDWLADEAGRLAISKEPYTSKRDGEQTSILTKIMQEDEIVGFAGITYREKDEMTSGFQVRMYWSALFISLGGIIAFLILFHLIRHEYKVKRLLLIILPILIVMNGISVVNSYFVFKDGYRSIADEVARKLTEKNADDIDRLIAEGFYYEDFMDTDAYYSDIADRVDQIASIRLGDTPEEGAVTRELAADGNGQKAYLSVTVSSRYIYAQVRSAVLNVIVSAVSAVMIASELLLLLIGLIVEDKRERRKKKLSDGTVTLEHLEVVRGLSFFFATFRYMSVAFMAVVLAEIYRPISVFGHELPYEIVLSIPLSAQVFISMITSYVSGIMTEKRGWKKVTMVGLVVMVTGTLVSAFATEPVFFIGAQMIVGVGLGFAKMGIDIYSVAVASEADMSMFTANANASIVVGFSCSALIGALLADIFGYSGAYIAMSVVGLVLIVLVFFFGMDVQQVTAKKEDEKVKAGEKKLDVRFMAYILFIIIPYFFLMMFVDYFFPVYAVGQGITMNVIGYVMLFYGMATAYIGTTLCERLMKRFSPAALMVVTMVVMAAAILLFAMRNYVVFAALIVILIGIADGIMPSAQFDYLYHLPLSERIGFSRTLGIEGFFSNLIGAVAPIVFGIVMMKGNGGLAVVALVTFLSAILFTLLNGRRKAAKKSACIVLALILSFVPVLQGVVKAQTGNRTDRKLVIGCCQAESYYEFDFQLYDIAQGMVERGELSELSGAVSEGSLAEDVWEQMAGAGSDEYSISVNHFFDLSDPEYAKLSDEELNEVLGKAIRDENIDLMITMGTAAGLAVRNCCDVPYMNFLASDPVDSGIVEGVELSGNSRGWAHVNNGVDQKALAVMQDIFAPKKVGIVYNMEDPDAYIYSSAKSVDDFAAGLGIEVKKKSVSDDFDVTDEAYEDYIAQMLRAHQELAGSGIDLYILTTSLIEPVDFAKVMEPFVEKGIPVFSVNSTEDVRYVATAAVEMFDYRNIGRFAAETLAKYHSGEELDTLTQKYDTAPFLVLNVDTMHRSGIRLPLEVLLSVNEVYGRYEE